MNLQFDENKLNKFVEKSSASRLRQYISFFAVWAFRIYVQLQNCDMCVMNIPRNGYFSPKGNHPSKFAVENTYKARKKNLSENKGPLDFQHQLKTDIKV